MKRRDFLLEAGAAAIGLPRSVASQHGSRRLGVLMGYRESDKEAQARLAAFFQIFEEPRLEEWAKPPC